MYKRQEKDENGGLPLHWAAEKQAPLEVVEALLRAHEDGAKEEDRREEALVALHFAAKQKARKKK